MRASPGAEQFAGSRLLIVCERRRVDNGALTATNLEDLMKSLASVQLAVRFRASRSPHQSFSDDEITDPVNAGGITRRAAREACCVTVGRIGPQGGRE